MKVPFEMYSPLSPKLNRNRRRWLNSGLASVAVLSQSFIAGCSWKVERTFEYLQDVKLNDGKIITVRFKDVILANGRDTDKYKMLLKQEMWYAPLGIYYLDDPRGRTEAHRLKSFDIVNGIPMLVQLAHQDERINRRVPQNCVYNYLRWVGNNWIEVRESEFPLHIVGYNLDRATYKRVESGVLQKREMSNPPAMGDTPLTMLDYSKGVGNCLGTHGLNKSQNKEETK